MAYSNKHELTNIFNQDTGFSDLETISKKDLSTIIGIEDILIDDEFSSDSNEVMRNRLKSIPNDEGGSILLLLINDSASKKSILINVMLIVTFTILIGTIFLAIYLLLFHVHIWGKA